MAKFTIELPEWTEERTLRLHAGVELAAEKYPWEEYWRVKDKRCTRCGECCRNIKERSSHPYPLIDGACIHLVPEPGTTDKFRCDIALYRSRVCDLDPNLKMERGICPITHKEQKLE